MSEVKTELYLVNDLQQALAVAHELGALGIGLDVEGVIIPYVGNNPTNSDIANFSFRPFRELQADETKHRQVKRGLMTNNENNPIPEYPCGVVEWVARSCSFYQEVPFVHKGMYFADNTSVGKKPSGEQGTLLASMLGLKPEDMVLIDDQGVKNTGEAVKAGFKAMIAPNPIGEVNERGQIIEHKGVMRFRKVEPMIYKSLENRGNIAAAAFKIVAGIELSQIGHFEDRRK